MVFSHEIFWSVAVDSVERAQSKEMAPKKRKEIQKDFVDQDLPEDNSEDEDFEEGENEVDDESDDEEDGDGSDGSDDNEDTVPTSETLVTPMAQAEFNSVFKQAPKLSILSRKRKTRTNNTGRANKSQKAKNKSDPDVSPEIRLAEFPNDYFSIRDEMLFCECCCHKLAVKSASLVKHIACPKHLRNKCKMREDKKRMDQMQTLLSTPTASTSSVAPRSAISVGLKKPVYTDRQHRYLVCEALLESNTAFSNTCTQSYRALGCYYRQV